MIWIGHVYQCSVASAILACSLNKHKYKGDKSDMSIYRSSFSIRSTLISQLFVGLVSWRRATLAISVRGEAIPGQCFFFGE